MRHTEIVNNIFDDRGDLTSKAFNVFQYQYAQNKVYRSWNDILHTDIASITSLNNIPFLPISFFKTHKVVCGDFEPEAIFQSSGTTQSTTSNHYIKDVALYKQSFLKCFELFYGDIKDWCIIGLLPSYLERKNSSLVLMVDELIKKSRNEHSGFYLYEFEKLKEVLMMLENQKQKTLLIGVTFALLDFAQQF